MKTILVIEDNKDVRENICEILNLSNYEAVGAKNGTEGVDIAKSNLPDLILCDVLMPELDGYGVLEILQKDKKTMNIPFIFLTARAERDEFRKGMEMGADDYVTKPFNTTELLHAIKTRLRKLDAMKAEFQKNNKK